jgi:hypothetical protein
MEVFRKRPEPSERREIGEGYNRKRIRVIAAMHRLLARHASQTKRCVSHNRAANRPLES